MRDFLNYVFINLRSTASFLRNILALIGLVSIVFLWIRTIPGANPKPSSDAFVVSSALSPDGKFKAIEANENGGGGIAPYCFDSVYVASSKIPDEKALDEENLVLSGSCGVLKKFSARSFDWASPTRLNIPINPTEGVSGISVMRLRGWASGGQVRVTYDRQD